jgi:AraC-like DNA-binding protein
MEGDPVDMRVVYIHFDILFDPVRSNWNMIIPGGCTDLAPFSRLMHPPLHDPEIEGLNGLITEWPGRKASDLLIRICLEYERAVNPDHIFLSGLTLQLIRELISIRNSDSGKEGRRWRALAGAEEYIHTNLDRDLDVAALANRFKLSVSHFRKLFKERFGISPVGMHRKLRIAKGSELLVYSDMNVSEAAFALGYSTVHSFSKAFRQVTGTSPTEFKKGK